jgi:hypothetical protein
MSMNFGTQPVAEPTVDATTEQTGGSSTPVEKTFTQDELNKFAAKVRAEEKKKYQKSVDELANKKATPVVPEADNKYSHYEQQILELNTKLSGLRSNQLGNALKSKLSEHGCLDPDLVAGDFLNRKLVSLDDDDSIYVAPETGAVDIDDLVKGYLSKKPHLVKATQSAGLGTKSPGTLKFVPDSSQIKNMTSEQYQAWKEQNNIVKPNDKWFGK